MRIKAMPNGADHRSLLSRRMHPPLQIVDPCNSGIIEEELPLPDTNLKLRVSSADGARKQNHRADDNLKKGNRAEVVLGVHCDGLSLGSLHEDVCAQQEHVCTRAVLIMLSDPRSACLNLPRCHAGFRTLAAVPLAYNAGGPIGVVEML